MARLGVSWCLNHPKSSATSSFLSLNEKTTIFCVLKVQFSKCQGSEFSWTKIMALSLAMKPALRIFSRNFNVVTYNTNPTSSE